MADYLKDVPNGTMMIRDTGGWVEFWFKTGPSTWNNQQTWGYGANGDYWQGDYRLVTGGNWQKFGAVFITDSQDVLFRIIGEGLGWPTTDFVRHITRGIPPNPPYPPRIVDREATRIRVALDYGNDNGMPIDIAEIWHSHDRTPRVLHPATRDAWISGLSPNTDYYFWGKTHNARGWSGFSGYTVARTLGVPSTPMPPDIKATGIKRAAGGFRTLLPAANGSPILEYQIGYGTNPSTPQLFSSSKDFDKSDLQAAAQYYFWARARNAVGWSKWSGRTAVLLPSGAWVKDNDVWKRALPWVNVNGVWRVAQTRVKSGGAWRFPKT